MDFTEEVLDVRNFILSSSRDVQSVVKNLESIQDKNMLVHVKSFIHNTVLVQTLKKELESMLINADISLLKHDDREVTCIDVFILKNDSVNKQDLKSYIINELYVESKKKEISLASHRNKLFTRYFTDHLTNLPNVYQLRKDLDEHEEFGLIIFNIDNFQTINNFYGFIVGDYVIEKVGEYLKNHINKHSVYRLSGDEFAFILDESKGFYELKDFLTELYEEMKDINIEYQGINIVVNFTLASSAKRDHKNMFSNVSMALKYAKQMSLPFWIYEERMHFEDEYERNIKLSAIVRDAIENSNILPYFQAIVDTKTQEIKKYECLARLIDANGKILSPVLFIPISKNIKVYSEVTKIIINKSFEMFENSKYEFSINLSIEDIMNSDIFKFILDKLKDSNASRRVTFEILESDAIEDFKKVERFVSEVKRYGAKIAIDDFGSGYSNFAYLTKMSADYIKIDGSLIKNIDVDKNSLIVVETIVEFANKLGMQTIAEFVHSSTVMDKVKELGIDYSQGFYLDEPTVTLK
ncbi:bifunctional diguanylate cyclase/phosphodiesterase [Sulfurimonas sp.]|nr:bifunctional diguanylate cyclase/phosphodiesterase [Sulfurimonas sp.]